MSVKAKSNSAVTKYMQFQSSINEQSISGGNNINQEKTMKKHSGEFKHKNSSRCEIVSLLVF